MEPKGFRNPLASGLSRNGKVGAWIVALGAVAAWNYYDNQRSSNGVFTKEEQESWNQKKEAPKTGQGSKN